MAGTLTGARATWLALPLLALGTAWASGTDTADPTRPPAAVAATAASAPSAAGAEPALQAVYLPKGGRPVAWINGERLPLGARIGEEKLVRISETEVVLRGSGGERHLLLVPAVSMKPASAAPQTVRREK